MLGFLIRRALRAVLATHNTPEKKGAKGERLVHSVISSVLLAAEYRLLTDVILPTPRGTTQIDHIIVSRFGIFVIETKNMSGWIFGDPNKTKWTQILRGGKRCSFQNPIRQNFAHLTAIREVLGVDLNILHNVVIFVGTAEPKTPMPENVVWGFQELGKLMASKGDRILSEVEMNKYEEILRRSALPPTVETRREHIKGLENRLEITAKKESNVSVNKGAPLLCPECNSEMVTRTNRRTGDTFWGCTDFPRCRGTREGGDKLV